MQACEKWGETTRRKLEHEGPLVFKPEKLRRGGNETVEFLREKAKWIFFWKRKEEMIKKNEQEMQAKLFDQFLTNQQQQQQKHSNTECSATAEPGDFCGSWKKMYYLL